MPDETCITILVVDDDLPVQTYMCRVLRGAGYRVLEARDPVHAIELCQDYSSPIDLLITDVLMPPHINGRELAAKATAIRTTMQVLYVSGYVDDPLLHGLGFRLEIAFLHKPFDPSTFLRKVQDVLGSTSNPQ